MADVKWTDAKRSPSVDRNPLDLASFYVEELKYGPGSGKLELMVKGELVGELETLLRDAGVTSMTGEQLARAVVYYGVSFADIFQLHPMITLSIFIDGLMHGIALAGGLEGESREPK